MSATEHEIVIGVHGDSFVRAIRCLHQEDGGICAPDEEMREDADFEDVLEDFSWEPERPRQGVCFWEDYFFGMGDFFAYNADAPETLTLFETAVSVVSTQPLAVRVDDAGDSLFTIRGADGTINMELDGKYVTDIDIPLEFLVVHPARWTFDGETFEWVTEGQKRVLRPGDSSWEQYAAIVTTA